MRIREQGSEEDKHIVGTTSNGKVLSISRNRVDNLYYIQYTTGGEVPEQLRGGWNNLTMAKIKCKHYLDVFASGKRYNAKSDSNKAV